MVITTVGMLPSIWTAKKRLQPISTQHWKTATPNLLRLQSACGPGARYRPAAFAEDGRDRRACSGPALDAEAVGGGASEDHAGFSLRQSGKASAANSWPRSTLQLETDSK